MAENDRKLWDQRYATQELIHGGSPSEFLVASKEYLPTTGLALDLASGEGRNALFLTEIGFEVIALDISEPALRKCRNRAIRAAAKILPAVVDLERFRLPSRQFDVVLNFNYLNRALSDSIVESLKTSGVLIFETLTRDHLRWRPDFNPRFLLEIGELAGMFARLTLLKYREVDVLEGGRQRSVASLVGRRD